METYGRSMNELKCLLRLPTSNNSPPNGGALGEGVRLLISCNRSPTYIFPAQCAITLALDGNGHAKIARVNADVKNKII